MTKRKDPASEWVIAERKRLGWKVEDLHAHLNAAGHAVALGTLRVWESGQRPGAVALQAMEHLFGSTPPAPEGPLVVVSPAQLEAMLERAAERGARRVLAELEEANRDA